MRQKLSLHSKSSSVQAERKNWVEPLRKWILDSKRAGVLGTSENLHEMRDFLRSFGTNPLLQDKTISISFCPPSEFARKQKTDSILSPFSAPLARGRLGLSEPEVSMCGEREIRTPGRVSPTQSFQDCRLNRSRISPNFENLFISQLS